MFASIAQLFVFTLDLQRYAIAASAVERVVRMVYVTPLPAAPDIVLGVIDVRGRTIPVVDMRRRLGLPLRAPRVSDHLVIVTTPRRRLALPVDEASGLIEVAADAVDAAHDVAPNARHVSGIVRLRDGLVFLHDIDAFLSLDEEAALAAATASSPRADAGAGAGAGESR